VVCISPHRSDRRNRRECSENFRFADITGMDNQFGADKSIDYPGVEITVGVGYNADAGNSFPRRFSGHVLSFLYSVS
jgi:hypothetical protein